MLIVLTLGGGRECILKGLIDFIPISGTITRYRNDWQTCEGLTEFKQETALDYWFH